ncbi:hypothetical protein EZS27_005944 [termite gut metagenome]|uniref:N-acetyltransferase domain-containing protein n=1 Tax=termite gut metagenome TaxID=433724 RepID=A0A5J4SMA5_9ZZZZ
MSFLDASCTFRILDKETMKQCPGFSCGHDDLDNFFYEESESYNTQLIGKSYCFILNENPEIVCAFTVSNASIRVDNLPSSRKNKLIKNIPHEKHFNNYPAVLIGRLGVNKNYVRTGIGSELMYFMKHWFVDLQNKTGCRYLIVDSYNDPIPLEYYKKNGFDFIFSTENQEKEYTHSKAEDKLSTRLMYFDLIRCQV